MQRPKWDLPISSMRKRLKKPIWMRWRRLQDKGVRPPGPKSPHKEDDEDEMGHEGPEGSHDHHGLDGEEPPKLD